MDRLFENRLLEYLKSEGLASDEDLSNHDLKFHGGCYDPSHQACSLRERLERDDAADDISTPSQTGQEDEVASCGRYYGTGMQKLAHGIKDGDAAAIAKSGAMMAGKIPDGAILIPMPGHSGVPVNELRLANEIAKRRKGVEVVDCLRSNAHESSYALKKKGRKSRMGIEMFTEGRPKDFGGRPVFVVDNVISSGSTWDAAKKALPKSRLLVLADAREV